MEVEILNKKTIKSERTKPPTIQFFRMGQIRISVGAAKILGLMAGDRIEFLIHRADKEIIYFTKSDSGFELKAEKTKQGKSRLLILCRPLTKKLSLFFDIKESKTFDVTDEIADFYGRKCWFILKKNNHIPLKWRIAS